MSEAALRKQAAKEVIKIENKKQDIINTTFNPITCSTTV